MTKIRSSTDLQTQLDREFAWRLKEMDDLRKSVRTAPGTIKRGLIRSGIAINYAHWEGFVKRAAETYLEFVAAQKLRCKELKPNFLALGSRKLKVTGEITNIRVAHAYLTWITTSGDLVSDIPFDGAIKTRANLSFTVFEDICITLGIDSTPYSTKSLFIDESLVRRRNAVAHGEFLEVDEAGYESMTDEVIGLLRRFKNDIENSVYLVSYRN